jgi:diaminopimelate decarboxylase
MKNSLQNKIKLTPILSPFTQKVLKDKRLLFEFVDAFSSPLNIIFPEQIQSNFALFSRTLMENNISGKVCFAHKANRSKSFIKSLSVIKDSVIDVASKKELVNALEGGFTGERISATGPKDTDFLMLAIQHGVLINIDSEEELFEIINLTNKLSLNVKITLRLTGFNSRFNSLISKESRFGIPLKNIAVLLPTIKKASTINFVGFSFHLDSVSLNDKIYAIDEVIALIPELKEHGLNMQILNIGGGYKANYVKNPKEWHSFVNELNKSVLGERESFTWNNYAFGLSKLENSLRGNLNIYSFYEKTASHCFLKEILNTNSFKFKLKIGQLLRDNLLKLYIEPGRSMLDQCGITVSKVTFTKYGSNNNLQIGLSMNKSDVSFMDHELLTDPILLQNNAGNDKPSEGYLIGNLCLEGDIILRRKIFFKKTPRKGDLIVFINTAGYYSDFSANSAIMQHKAEKISVYKKDDKKLSWCLDENYMPLNFLKT